LDWRCIFRCNRFGAAWVEPTDRGDHVGCVEQILGDSVASNGLAVEGMPGGKVKGKKGELSVATFPGLI
jgi:hypothetical protein